MDDKDQYYWAHDIWKHQAFIQQPAGEDKTSIGEFIEFIQRVEANTLEPIFLSKIRDICEEVRKIKSERGHIWWN